MTRLESIYLLHEQILEFLRVRFLSHPSVPVCHFATRRSVLLRA